MVVIRTQATSANIRERFDFLFTHYCGKPKQANSRYADGQASPASAFGIRKVRRVSEGTQEYLYAARTWESISQMVRGHYHYYGVSENSKSLWNYKDKVKKLLYKWLNRRSQKKSYTWESFKQYVFKYPLPEPKIFVSFYNH
ncbi:MAG: hypothetical protein IPM69_12050 [Ignavibacteria bacterium]|nr:hypothetical protein [Ignavibacteria bacterium]